MNNKEPAFDWHHSSGIVIWVREPRNRLATRYYIVDGHRPSGHVSSICSEKAIKFLEDNGVKGVYYYYGMLD